jgi:hypothetical protein
MTLVVSATECLLSPQVSTATVYPSSGAADNTGHLRLRQLVQCTLGQGHLQNCTCPERPLITSKIHDERQRATANGSGRAVLWQTRIP